MEFRRPSWLVWQYLKRRNSALAAQSTHVFYIVLAFILLGLPPARGGP